VEVNKKRPNGHKRRPFGHYCTRMAVLESCNVRVIVLSSQSGMMDRTLMVFDQMDESPQGNKP